MNLDENLEKRLNKCKLCEIKFTLTAYINALEGQNINKNNYFEIMKNYFINKYCITTKEFRYLYDKSYNIKK